MIKLISTNITSPLGMTTEQNYKAVLAGDSALTQCKGVYGIPESITASLMSDAQVEQMHAEGFSRFESMVIHSVSDALDRVPASCAFDVASPRSLFVLSTTKADVESLEHEMGFNASASDVAYSAPGACARHIASRLGFTTEPVVVCNACISGVSAQVLSNRLIASGEYDHVVICGADCQSLFVIAGFLSFKALSPVACRPFDIERNGLNLGEGAATMVVGRVTGQESESFWTISGCHLDNDSYHISAPAPDGNGVARAITAAVPTREALNRIGAICAHGTATMFNDQMESRAIACSGCSDIPVSAVKGCYGHTLGASGVLETILGLRAMDDAAVLPSRGFEETGVSGKVDISARSRTVSDGRTDFLKIISGFGGCNGAVLWHKADVLTYHPSPAKAPGTARVAQLHSVRITPDSAFVDGKKLPTSATGKALLTELYKTRMGDYPKFYKMDAFTRLVVVSSDLLVAGTDADSATAVVLFNASSSIVADRNHLGCIWNGDEFLPSPSAFIYTLPNIATGEVAIKHGYKSETTLYILDHKDDSLMNRVIASTLADPSVKRLVTGWVDCPDEDIFEADLKLLTIN